MTKTKIVYSVFMLSYVAAMAASVAGVDVMAMYLGAPALLLSGCAVIGHVVTLDDDMLGGWSNPNGSKKLWHLSVGELGLKAVIFVALLWVVYAKAIEALIKG